jgi:hypothetical protein
MLMQIYKKTPIKYDTLLTFFYFLLLIYCAASETEINSSRGNDIYKETKPLLYFIPAFSS